MRVDILYAGFHKRTKAWVNFIGSLVLGIPLCWIILTRGMWGKTNLINGPMLNYEVTQAGSACMSNISWPGSWSSIRYP